MPVTPIPQLQFVPAALGAGVLPGAGGPGMLQPVVNSLCAFVTQPTRRDDALLLPRVRISDATAFAQAPTGESVLPPWHNPAGQAAVLEALAGLNEPEDVEILSSHVTFASQPHAIRSERTHVAIAARQSAKTLDVAHPPAPPKSVVGGQRGQTTEPQKNIATQQASQRAAHITATPKRRDIGAAQPLAWLKEGPSTHVRAAQSFNWTSWLVKLQQTQPHHILFKAQEQLILPMLSRVRLRIGGTLGSDIDASHETEDARADTERDSVLGVAELPQQKLASDDLNQPMRLFYDLISRQRHARQKLRRI